MRVLTGVVFPHKTVHFWAVVCLQPSRADTYFSTAEMMTFSRAYIGWIKAIDTTGRPVGSDMGKPRTRAAHLAVLTGGGAACVSPSNPQGDCEANCTGVPRDSEAQYKSALAEMSEPFDLVRKETAQYHEPDVHVAERV